MRQNISSCRVVPVAVAMLAVACLARPTPADDAPDRSPAAQNPAATHWSFQRPQRTTPPDVGQLKHRNRVRNPIDQFVFHRLQKAELEPAGEAERRTLVRRAHFDLLGLPPSPEDMATFLADRKPGAWNRLIDRLLQSRHYGERWGRHWLDVARYADSGGYETDIYYRNAWRFRDYVVRSFNEDRPFDRFTTEQLAGDEIAARAGNVDPRNDPDVRDALIAVGFHRLASRRPPR